jgi:hypothetical protein
VKAIDHPRAKPADGKQAQVFNFSTWAQFRADIRNWPPKSAANMMWKTFLVHSSWYGKGEKMAWVPPSWALSAVGVFHPKWVL